MAGLSASASWAERDPLPQTVAPVGAFGLRFVHHASVTSTNDLARAAALDGAPEGLVISADLQTAGRGRHGRRWESPPGAGLLCSILLRPALPPALALRAGMYVALAAAAAIERAAAVPVGLKWPNDLLIHERKVAGVLAESGILGERLDFVVVGIGIDVHWQPDDPGTTALDAAARRVVPRRALLDALLAELARWRPLLERREPDRLLAAWRGRLVTLGRLVEVHGLEHPFNGTALGVADDGALQVRDASGVVHAVHAADVTLRPAPER